MLPVQEDTAQQAKPCRRHQGGPAPRRLQSQLCQQPHPPLQKPERKPKDKGRRVHVVERQQ